MQQQQICLKALLDRSVVAAAAAMYQEQVLSYKHLDEPLDDGRLAGNLQVYHV